MIFDAYETYCAHQRALGQPVPSHEWWDMACKARPTKPAQVQDQAQTDLEFDYAKEREGDAQ